jgi:hypothetical protein
MRLLYVEKYDSVGKDIAFLGFGLRTVPAIYERMIRRMLSGGIA